MFIKIYITEDAEDRDEGAPANTEKLSHAKVNDVWMKGGMA